jgi:hypothetical protein
MNLHELKLESQTYKLFIKPQKKTIINYDKEDPLIFVIFAHENRINFHYILMNKYIMHHNIPYTKNII